MYAVASRDQVQGDQTTVVFFEKSKRSAETLPKVGSREKYRINRTAVCLLEYRRLDFHTTAVVASCAPSRLYDSRAVVSPSFP